MYQTQGPGIIVANVEVAGSGGGGGAGGMSEILVEYLLSTDS